MEHLRPTQPQISRCGDWEKQPEWHGNPALSYESWKKTFVNPHTGRKVPVYVFGKPDGIPDYCVSAGHDSDFSYTGSFYPERPDFPEAMRRINQQYEAGQLFI